MVVIAFLVNDQTNQVRFFKKTFLLANLCQKVVFEMLFLILSSVNVNFLKKKLKYKIYTIM